MSRLVWDKAGERLYETGVDKVALYLLTRGGYAPGVAWNGVTAINENPSGAESTPFYADNIKYLNLVSTEDFAATLESYSYPAEFQQCIGEIGPAPGVIFSQQRRVHFGLVYRSLVGNDQDGTEYGYKLHVVFDGLAGPSDRNRSTVNDNPDIVTNSWDISTSTVTVPGHKPTARLTLDSRKFQNAGFMNILHRLEERFYGSDTDAPTFLTISEILDTYELEMYLRDEDGDAILDSDGNKIQSRVFE